MLTTAAGIVLVLIACCATAGGAGPALRWLPEPRPPTDADELLRSEYADKVAYRSLGSRRFVLGTSAAAGAAMLVAVLTTPAPVWGCWLVLSTLAVLLAAIDAVSTWLPSALIYPGWLVMAAAVLLTALLSPGAAEHRLVVLLTVLGSAAAAGLAFLLLWRVTAGRAMAFGDVRLMPLVGAAAGTLGWSGVYWAVLLGTLIGAAIGVVRLLRRRHGPFPYAPALVAGPYAAAVLLRLW